MTDKIPIPAAAIEAGAEAVAVYVDIDERPGCDVRLSEAVLRAAAPHMLKDADLELAIEHLHNDVGTLTEQLNRVTHALHRIVTLERAPVSRASAIAHEALRALEGKR